jgi:hypothetical protein
LLAIPRKPDVCVTLSTDLTDLNKKRNMSVKIGNAIVKQTLFLPDFSQTKQP